jgi:16S rRNA (uracil1498-N3)-methyltransferase
MDHARDGAMKRPARFTISSADFDGTVALVGGPELHHMRDVMRLAPGARVELLDESGAQYAGIIRQFEARRAVVEIAGRNSPSPPAAGELMLAAAVIKGARMDYLVEKAVELGAAEIWPLIAARGAVRDVGAERLARWRRLANAAAKQSFAPRSPVISGPISLQDLIRRTTVGRLGFVLSAGAPPLAGLVRDARAHAFVIVCGPEGDFTPAEAAALRTAGFLAAGLGPQRLRSETAALAALSIAAGAIDELHGGPHRTAEKVEP